MKRKKSGGVRINLLRSASALVFLPWCLLAGNAQEQWPVPSLPDRREIKSVDEDYGDKRFTNELGVWAGGSLYVRSRRTDRSDDARIFILGLSFARPITVRRSFSLRYTADVVPLMVLSHPRVQAEPPEGSPGSGQLKRMAVRGTGLSPLGLRINFRPRSRIQPFLDLKGGFIVFDKRIPTARGTQFNFTAQSGGGVEVLTGPRTSVTFGSRFHHISNGGLGLTNPGFNTVMLFSAFTIRK